MTKALAPSIISIQNILNKIYDSDIDVEEIYKNSLFIFEEVEF